MVGAKYCTEKMPRLIALLLVTLGPCLGCGPKRVNVHDVEKDIRQHVPLGSSRAAVIEYLDGKHIGHSVLEDYTVGTNGNVVAINRHIEIAVIPDVRQTGLILRSRVSIEIQFQFDNNDSTLISSSVREVYKSL
jgi:hypothetical protein